MEKLKNIFTMGCFMREYGRSSNKRLVKNRITVNVDLTVRPGQTIRTTVRFGIELDGGRIVLDPREPRLPGRPKSPFHENHHIQKSPIAALKIVEIKSTACPIRSEPEAVLVVVFAGLTRRRIGDNRTIVGMTRTTIPII